MPPRQSVKEASLTFAPRAHSFQRLGARLRHSGQLLRASKSALRVESQKFLHTWNRKVTLKPTSKARTEKIKNALTVHDSKGNEVS